MIKHYTFLTLIVTFFVNNLFAQQPPWTQKTDFLGTARDAGVSFAIGNKGYFGTGLDVNGALRRDFWEYDPATDSWTQMADYGGAARFSAVEFVINDTGYVGLGSTGYPNYVWSTDFWMFDPTHNTWIQKNNFPGPGRYDAARFVINGKGYMGTGWAGPLYKDFWEYDPASDSWTQKKDFPSTERQSTAYFAYGGKGYIGLGANGGTFYKDMYQYDPSSDTWVSKGNYGGTVRNNTTNFIVENSIYVGLGYSDAQGFMKDIWKYDPSNDSWSLSSVFPGTARFHASSFVLGCQAYIIAGYGGKYDKDVWAAGFCDTVKITTTQTNIACFGNNNGTASVSVKAGIKPFTYKWSPGSYATSAITGLIAGTYTVVVTDSLGLSASDTVRITQPTKVVASASGNLSVCSGGSTTMTASASGGTGLHYTFNWDGTATASTYSITPVSTTQHYLIATDSVGCVSDTFFFTISIRQNSKSTSDVSICNGQTFVLPDGTSVSPTKSTSYTTTLTSANGCDSIVTTNVTVNANTGSSVAIGICSGQNITLPDGSTVMPVSSTSYTTHISNTAGCDSAIITNVTVNANTGSSVHIGICNGQSIILPDGSTVSPGASTTYITHISNAAGCDSTITTNVTVGAQLSVTISASPTIGCIDHTIYIGYGPEDVTLTANTGVAVNSYQWYLNGSPIGGATSQTLVVNTSGSYNVIVTGAGGCSSTLDNTTSLVINVVDIRCGEHNQKVVLCHVPPGNPDNPQTLCIAPSAVPAHLRNHPGDCLGTCLSDSHGGDGKSPGGGTDDGGKQPHRVVVNIFPNPFISDFVISPSEIVHHLNVEIYDMTGRMLFQQSFDSIYSLNPVISLKEFPAGTYFISLIVDGNRITKPILKMTE